MASLTADLRALGLPFGATVMVHSSLARLGYVAGGAHAVVAALLEVLGPGGTLVMPTHSGDLSDPAGWRNPPVPEAWWQTIKDEMPPFDAELTPTRQMGAIVECFRHVRGARRSDHPTVSATALGPNTDGSDDFEQIGDAFAETGLERHGSIAAGRGRLFRVRDIVDFGVRWIETHRT